MYPNIALRAAGTGMLLLLLSAGAAAQFIAGSSFYIMPGTPVTIDSLTLEPAVVGADLSNTSLTVSHVSIPPAGAGSGSVARVYQFNPAISFRGTTGIYYLNSELNGNTPASLSFVYDNGSNTFTTNAVVTINNNNNYVVATTGINTVTLKRITLVDAGVPLPVDLLSFTAKAEGSRSLIEWTTAREFNCDHFDVERSSDGRSFHFLVAENAAGNGTAEHRYKTYDDQPFDGWNYYRLKQVDADGRFSWSPIAKVFFGGKDGAYVSVYPNPVQNRLSIAMSSRAAQSVTLLLMDVSGRVLQSRPWQLATGDNTFSLDMSDLAAGSYLLRIGATFQTKVVKQK